MLFCFEGINGSGKSTVATLFVAELQRRGVPAVLLYDPGVAEGDANRDELCRLAKYEQWSHWLTRPFLFAAARCELVGEINRQLAKSRVVVLDRYVMSFYAYQLDDFIKATRGDERSAMLAMELLLGWSGAVQPDMTFYLDVDPGLALSRFNKRADVFESGGHEALKRIAERYKLILECAPPFVGSRVERIAITELVDAAGVLFRALELAGPLLASSTASACPAPVRPAPVCPAPRSARSKPKSDVENAINDLRALIDECEDLETECSNSDFLTDVREQASRMLCWIEENLHVTDNQLRAIDNWTDGVSRWRH